MYEATEKDEKQKEKKEVEMEERKSCYCCRKFKYN